MKSRKGLLTSDLSDVLVAMLADAGLACNTSTNRDWKTIQSRVEHEGQSFLTITLPTFAKGFERSLEASQWLTDLFTSFKAGKGTCLPAFLQGFTSLVFNTKTGALHENPSIEAVEAVRQICLCLNKIKEDCTKERQRSAVSSFVSCELEISRFRVKDWPLRDNYRKVASSFLSGILGRLSCAIQGDGWLPTRHGPGSTNQGIFGNRKFLDNKWSRRLSKVLPFDRYWFVNHNEASESLGTDGLDFEEVSSKDEIPARVQLVPKTQKAPRVIAIEPVYNQYVQQGLMGLIVPMLESDKLTGGQINFSDQSINGNLALESSLTQEFATIDMKEASDRVSASLVHLMLLGHPDLIRLVFACRSKYASLPDGTKVPLKKFASQGSALCFPFEAMVFFTIIVASFMETNKLPVGHPRVRQFARKVFVYGDDIVIPTKEVDTAIMALESAGLKVNRGKSFAAGHFRESCGTDAYLGYKVTPVYIRVRMPERKSDAEEILSYVASANLFYRKGYWKTCECIRSKIERIVGVVPHVLSTSSIAGWYSYLGTYNISRWNKQSQCFEVRGLVPGIKKKSDPLVGYRALAKYFTEKMETSISDILDRVETLFVPGHERVKDEGGQFDPLLTLKPLDQRRFAVTPRRGSVYIKSRWASPT